MDSMNVKGNYIDFFSVNSDWSGRTMSLDQETVNYHNNSTVRIWYNQQSESYPMHWHSAMEVIMPVENFYDVTVNEQPYHVMPGEVLFIPPRDQHTLTPPEDGGARFIFLFDISLIASLKGGADLQSILLQPIYLTKDNYPKIYEDVCQTMIQIRNEYFGHNIYSELTIYALLIELLVKFGNNHAQTEDLFPNVRLYKQQEYVEKFSDVLNYIDAHYMEELTLEDVAAATGFSKYHFSRLFKQYTNYTFCDYLCFRRIKVAEELLMRRDLSITEVALQSGFPSISTFNRLFKQQKNCTPSVYRSRNSEEMGHFSTPGSNPHHTYTEIS